MAKRTQPDFSLLELAHLAPVEQTLGVENVQRGHVTNPGAAARILESSPM